MSPTPAPVTPAELRRRVRDSAALQMKVRELAAEQVLTSREAAAAAARAKEKADLEAREAAAVALRLFGDTDLVAGLLDVPADELEREAKAVTAARAKEVIESLRAHASRPRTRRTRPTATPTDAAEPRTSEAADTSRPVAATGIADVG
ncbi:hypothetical protein [Streptomyces jumonjinensis]|uniref:Uncharacterized protein n=1 Tax=Streptomyces jumonjinensis TaxID=1945 RepID=A0A646KBK8_STRJU|nr:hypothetical protein [Streptomyces jumonjinensis]MQS99336.1 hypothetical protein [Streptomyces jumonjinensis]